MPKIKHSEKRLQRALNGEIRRVFEHPMPNDPTEIARWVQKDRVFDGTGVDYSRIISLTPDQAYPNLFFERGQETVRLMNIRPGDTLIDIGAGEGGFAFIGALLGAKVVAVENMGRNIAILKGKFQELGPLIQAAGGSFRLVEGDFSDPKVQEKAGRQAFKHVVATDLITPSREMADGSPKAPPTWEPDRIQSIIDGIARAKSTEPGAILFSVPEFISVEDQKTGLIKYTDQVPFLLQMITTVVNASHLAPQESVFVSVPYSWGIKRGVLYRKMARLQQGQTT